MKTRVLLSALLVLSSVAMADPDGAPFISHQLKELDKKVAADLGSGALTKADGDELKREIAEIRSVEQSEPSLTRATRRDMREKISKIDKDLERKEAQAKALSSASPTP